MSIEQLATRIETDTAERFAKDYPARTWKEGNWNVNVHVGKKYTRVDVGSSGRYIVINNTGEIFGIKAYGVIHKGHRYGTLDTIADWYWGGYVAEAK